MQRECAWILGGVVLLWSTLMFVPDHLYRMSMARAFAINFFVLAFFGLARLDARSGAPHFLWTFMFIRLLTFVGDRTLLDDAAFERFNRDPRAAIRAAIGRMRTDESLRYWIVVMFEFALFCIAARLVHGVRQCYADHSIHRIVDLRFPGGTKRLVDQGVAFCVAFAVATILRARYVYNENPSIARWFEPLVVATILASSVLSEAMSSVTLPFVLGLIGARALLSNQGTEASTPCGDAYEGKSILIGSIVVLFAAECFHANRPPLPRAYVTGSALGLATALV